MQQFAMYVAGLMTGLLILSGILFFDGRDLDSRIARVESQQRILIDMLLVIPDPPEVTKNLTPKGMMPK